MHRIDIKVHHEFENLFKIFEDADIRLNSEIKNRILELSRNVSGLYGKALAELKTKGKLGVDIEYLNSDIKRIDLTKTDSPYWLNGDICAERPPGPTNSELIGLRLKIRDLISEFEKKINKLIEDNSDLQIKISSNLSHLELLILEEVKSTFVLPNINVKFNRLFYDRTPNSPLNYNQNTPCEICGENRSVDRCHIIPAEFGGTKSAQNTIYLCPTHHRLFDRMMLTREEWNKINWNKVGKTSANFAFHVTLPQMEKFWKKLDSGLFERNTASFATRQDLKKVQLKTILYLIEQHEQIKISDLAEISEIKKSVCLKLIEELMNQEKIINNKVGRNILYEKFPD